MIWGLVFVFVFLFGLVNLYLYLSDEDSEPILGPWFEETLTPESESKETVSNNQGPPPPVSGGTKPEAKKDAGKREDSPSITEVTDKEEPSQV